MAEAILTVVDDPERSSRTLEEAKSGQPIGLCEAALLVFEDISYRVPRPEGGKKEILSKVSGACRPGRLTALMGASGAGKSSLTDILTRTKTEDVTGRITLNGAPIDKAAFQRECCYVPQNDDFTPTDTVREHVVFKAKCQLPANMPESEKVQRADDILQQLELVNCANTRVGEEGTDKKGISGGERRRLSVAQALVTDPSIIMLDEPTSGLDSETATTLIRCLKKLAQANRTVVCSIHQPNSDIMDCFDDLLLLAGGRTAYYGPWHKSRQYFQDQGFFCPLYCLPSDYYLTITKEAGPQLTKVWARHAKEFLPEVLPGGYKGTGCHQRSGSGGTQGKGWFSAFSSPASSPRKVARRNLTFVDDDFIKVGIPEVEEDVDLEKDADLEMGLPREPAPRIVNIDVSACLTHPPATPYPPPSPGGMSVMSVAESYVSCANALPPPVPKPQSNYFYQMRVLFARNVRTWIRSPYLLWAFMLQYCFAGIFMGLMYYQLGTERASSIFDRQASLFLTQVMLAYTPSSASSTAWESERRLVRREVNAGTYSLTTFYLAKTAVVFPMQALICLMYCTLFYFIAGYQASAAKFAIFLLVCVLVTLISETIGGICALLTKTATMGIMLSSTLLTVLLTFSGFLISHVPVFFAWIPKISFVTYSYSAIYQNEFVGLAMNFALPGSQSGSPHSASEVGLSLNLGTSDYKCLPTGLQSTSRGPNGNNTTIGQNLAILACVLLSLRLLHYGMLQGAYRFKKL